MLNRRTFLRELATLVGGTFVSTEFIIPSIKKPVAPVPHVNIFLATQTVKEKALRVLNNNLKLTQLAQPLCSKVGEIVHVRKPSRFVIDS